MESLFLGERGEELLVLLGDVLVGMGEGERVQGRFLDEILLIPSAVTTANVNLKSWHLIPPLRPLSLVQFCSIDREVADFGVVERLEDLVAVVLATPNPSNQS